MKPVRTARPLITTGRLLIAASAAVLIGVLFYAGRAVSTGPADGVSFAGSTTPPPNGPYLRLATFNIDGGEGIDGKVDLTRTARCLQKVDVAAMEEVHATSDSDNQAEPLGTLLHLAYLFAPAERRWGHDTFGNAVFTDLPVTRWRRVVLPAEFLHAKRNYVTADLSWRGQPLHVFATHVDFKANGDEQLADVSNAFLAAPVPAVLLGDLNHPRSSPQIGRMIATPGVQECVSRVLDPVPGRVDWIFVRGLQTVDAGSVDLKASDHPAYWAEVRAIAPPATRP